MWVKLAINDQMKNPRNSLCYLELSRGVMRRRKWFFFSLTHSQRLHVLPWKRVCLLSKNAPELNTNPTLPNKHSSINGKEDFNQCKNCSNIMMRKTISKRNQKFLWKLSQHYLYLSLLNQAPLTSSLQSFPSFKN